jgi:hypothetical protein
VLQIKQDFLPKGHRNRPGHAMKPKGLLYHATANWNEGAGDEVHADYMKNTSRSVSWHVTVDKDSATQHIPFSENAWHAGDGSEGHYNRNWIGFEIACEAVKQGEPLDEATYWNAVDIAAQIMELNGLDQLKQIQPHKVVYGKGCPHHTLFDHDKFESDVIEVLSARKQGGTKILNKPRATVEQAQTWAKERGATDTFISLASLYWEIANEVDPSIAYAQSAKETAFGRFGGVVDESYNNPSGMKTKDGGGNYDPHAHQSFRNWREGVTAHIDHLALYAGALGYPKKDTPDPRHFGFIVGKAPTVEELSGRWAPSKEYGKSIINHYLKPLLETQAKVETSNPLKKKIEELEKDLERAQSEKVVAEKMAETKEKQIEEYQMFFKLFNKFIEKG